MPVIVCNWKTLKKVMLCYVMLCYVMLCYVMLCYVMLCYVWFISLAYYFSNNVYKTGQLKYVEKETNKNGFLLKRLKVKRLVLETF